MKRISLLALVLAASSAVAAPDRPFNKFEAPAPAPETDANANGSDVQPTDEAATAADADKPATHEDPAREEDKTTAHTQEAAKQVAALEPAPATEVRDTKPAV